MTTVTTTQKQRGYAARGFTDGLGELSEAEAAATVARLQAGDTDALGQLYRHGRRQVERYVARRMVDLNDVEDVVQEAFIRAPEMAKDFNPDTHAVGAWLCGRVARYTLTDYGRKDRFRHLSANDAAHKALSDAIHVGPPEAAHDRESRPLSPRMVHALARLSPAQRQSVQLRYLDELSTKEAGKVAGSSAAAIVANCLDARKRLRAELADLAPKSDSPLDGMTKKDAVLTALRTVGADDVVGALAWLRERGVTVDQSYVYAIRNGRRPVKATAEIAPKSDGEIAAAEEAYARVSASRHATKKEVACAAARLYEARNGRLPSPADLAGLVEGVSMRTVIVALREARQEPGDAAAARGMAQHAAPTVGEQLPAVDKTEAHRQPKRAQAYQAAQQFWSEHHELPTCDELAELATGISRGTCGRVLKEIRAAITEAQQPAVEPNPPAALAASRQQTDTALTAATAAAAQLRDEPTRQAEAEQERAQQVARWHADDRPAEATRAAETDLELAS